MLNCANTAEFRVGRLADILYMQFHAHVITDVKTKISGRRRKRYSTPQTEMVVGLETEKDLEDKRRRRVSVLSLLSLSLFSSIQVWMSDRQVSRLNVRWRDRDLELSIIR